MSHFAYTLKFICLLLSLSLLIPGCTPSKKLYLPPLKSGLKKPLIPEDSTNPKFSKASPTSQDINAEADFYALSVATGNWDMAQNMGTTANKLLLIQQVNPKLKAYFKQWDINPPLNPVVSFEKSQLVKENFDDQIVMESMQYATDSGDIIVLYLEFHITKVGDHFLVNDTRLLTKTNIFPGA